MWIKVLAVVCGIAYAFALFVFIPRAFEEKGLSLEDNYYKKCIFRLFAYIVIFFIYLYAYDWLEGFFTQFKDFK